MIFRINLNEMTLGFYGSNQKVGEKLVDLQPSSIDCFLLKMHELVRVCVSNLVETSPRINDDPQVETDVILVITARIQGTG